MYITKIKKLKEKAEFIYVRHIEHRCCEALGEEEEVMLIYYGISAHYAS